MSSLDCVFLIFVLEVVTRLRSSAFLASLESRMGGIFFLIALESSGINLSVSKKAVWIVEFEHSLLMVNWQETAAIQ